MKRRRSAAEGPLSNIPRAFHEKVNVKGDVALSFFPSDFPSEVPLGYPSIRTLIGDLLFAGASFYPFHRALPSEERS